MVLVLTFTAIRIFLLQIPETVHASVATSALHESLTQTPTSHQIMLRIRLSLTLTTVFRSKRITFTICAFKLINNFHFIINHKS